MAAYPIESGKLIVIPYLLNLAGDVFPVKVPLGSLGLSPTIWTLEEDFEVRYYVRIEIKDAKECRNYYQKIEITLYRREDD